jgi:hypothetical protein
VGLRAAAQHAERCAESLAYCWTALLSVIFFG